MFREPYARLMQVKPNKTIVAARLKNYAPASDGYGGNVELEVLENISPKPEDDFLQPAPGTVLRAFTAQPEKSLPIGRDVTAELTYIGGPGGGRAVLQLIRR